MKHSDPDKIKVYIATHKEYNEPDIPGYETMQVGAAINEKLPYAGDNTGDNISEKNPYYSELSAMYWVWKNDCTSDVVGVAHYRRYLFDRDDTILTPERISRILSENDIITSELMEVDEGETVLSRYSRYHHREDMESVRRVISEICPEYITAFDEVMDGTTSYLCNMFICKKEYYDNYCRWLFSVLFEAERYIDVSEYDTYNKRVYGLLSERLQTVWIKHNGLKVYEAVAKIVDEKSETCEMRVHCEKLIDESLWDDLCEDISEAYEKHNDIFLWASDITGRLSQIKMLADICGSEGKTGLKSGVFRKDPNPLNAEELYSVMDSVYAVVHAPNNDVAEVDHLVARYDLSPIFVSVVLLPHIEASKRVSVLAAIAEGCAYRGQMGMGGAYANRTIREAKEGSE